MSNPNETERQDNIRKVVEGITTGSRMQTRFTLIPSHRLNRETVAGIRDMNLGSIKNGVHVGRPTIRFDTGLNTQSHPHINIDPLGKISKNNPHIKVPAKLITSASKVQKTLKYVGTSMVILTVAIDAWRIGKSIYDDNYIMDHADELINELTVAIKELKDRLHKEDNPEMRKDIEESIEYLQKYLTNCRRAKKGIPSKTIETASSVAGGLGGGIAGGSGGAWLGAQTGAAIGLVFGPAGAAVGAPIGAVLGAISGGILGGFTGSKVAEELAEEGMKLAD